MNALLQSEDTQSLLQELTRVTGESEAIAKPLSDRLLSLGKVSASHFRNVTADNLYDKNGLPQ
jgi:hypothetical protein